MRLRVLVKEYRILRQNLSLAGGELGSSMALLQSSVVDSGSRLWSFKILEESVSDG